MIGDFEKIAKLARLDANDPDLDASHADLEKILVYFQAIQKYIEIESAETGSCHKSLPKQRSLPEPEDAVRDRIIREIPVIRNGEIEIPGVIDGADGC